MSHAVSLKRVSIHVEMRSRSSSVSFESTGGIGADYKVNDRVQVTGEAYDFGKARDPNPHLRVVGEYIFRKQKPNFPQLFVSTGVDNPLNDTGFILGGGIRWSDTDLKYLLGSVPLK